MIAISFNQLIYTKKESLFESFKSNLVLRKINVNTSTQMVNPTVKTLLIYIYFLNFILAKGKEIKIRVTHYKAKYP